MLMQRLSPETEFWEIPVFEVVNQHVLVTGGSSGFGRHFARILASNGAKVTLAAWPTKFVEALAENFTVVTFDNQATTETHCRLYHSVRIEIRLREKSPENGNIPENGRRLLVVSRKGCRFSERRDTLRNARKPVFCGLLEKRMQPILG